MRMDGKQLDDESDDALAGLARTGSGAAFAVLVTRHRGAVCVIARNMCATLREAEQALQQTFLSAWRDVRDFPAGTSFTTWLYRIAMSTALAQRQRERGRPSYSLEPFLPAFDRAGRLVASKGRWRDVDGTIVEEMEITGVLREALECIDDHARAAFVLRDLLELPLDEAGAILETSPGAIRRETHRVRLMLRGLIDRL